MGRPNVCSTRRQAALTRGSARNLQIACTMMTLTRSRVMPQTFPISRRVWTSPSRRPLRRRIRWRERKGSRPRASVRRSTSSMESPLTRRRTAAASARASARASASLACFVATRATSYRPTSFRLCPKCPDAPADCGPYFAALHLHSSQRSGRCRISKPQT